MKKHSSAILTRSARRRVRKVIAPNTEFCGYKVVEIQSGMTVDDLGQKLDVKVQLTDGTITYEWDIYGRVLRQGGRIVHNALPDFSHQWHVTLGGVLTK